MKNANLSTEHRPKGAGRNPDDRLGAKPKPGETTQANADVSEVVKSVKRRN